MINKHRLTSIAAASLLLMGSLAATTTATRAADDKSAEKAFTDGRWRLKDGTPTYKMGENGHVDWASWQGFRRYHDACHVCHGPNGAGSTFAPGLMDSLKTLTYEEFIQVVASGRVAERGGTKYVMPALGANRDVMCYIDDIYSYLKARADGVLPPGRPPGRADISEAASKAAKECLGD